MLFISIHSWEICCWSSSSSSSSVELLEPIARLKIEFRLSWWRLVGWEKQKATVTFFFLLEESKEGRLKHGRKERKKGVAFGSAFYCKKATQRTKLKLNLTEGIFIFVAN